jgi:rRNA maturation protein Nop10
MPPKYTLEFCPDCGKEEAATISYADSGDPVKFPGVYTTTECTSCGFYEYDYVPFEADPKG